MTISRAGTYIAFTSALASDSSSQSIPSDAECAIAFYVGYVSPGAWDISGMTMSIGGKSMALLQSTAIATAGSLNAFFLAEPPTGTQTISFATNNGAPDAGAHIIVVCYKSSLGSLAVRDSGKSPSLNADITGMVYGAADMMVGCAGDSGATPTVTDDSQTLIVDAGVYRSVYSGAAEETGDGSFFFTATGGAISAAVAVVLSENLNGTITFTGSATRKARYLRGISGAMGLSGAASPLTGTQYNVGVGGIITMSGDVTHLARFNRSLSGAMGMSGSLARLARYGRKVAATLSSSGAPGRLAMLSRSISGSMGFSGKASAGASQYTQSIAGVLSMSGSLSRSVRYYRSTAGALNNLAASCRQTNAVAASENIVSILSAPRTADKGEMLKWLQKVSVLLSYQEYVGDPTGNILPRWVGDRCHDTSNDIWYISIGVTAATWRATTS